MRWSRERSTCLGSRSAASWPRRSRSFVPRSCAKWCSPRRLRREPLSVFFTGTEASRAAGQEVLGRIYGARTVDHDAATDWRTRLAQYDAVCAWGQPNHSLLERVSAIDKPVFVAQDDSDPMILPRYSYLLAGLIPGARLKIYPDSAHGFLFQHHAEFAADVDAFLTGA
jgi:pimeloyl-ACP methyl ester carboxylesterase